MDPFAVDRYRERVFDSVVSGRDVHVKQSPPFDTVIGRDVPHPKWGRYESFHDTVSTDRVKPCDHYKLWGTPGLFNGGQSFYSSEGVGGYIGSSTVPNEDLITRSQVFSKIGDPRNSSAFQLAVNNAFFAFHTQVRSETDLPLALLTMGDILQLAISVRKFAQGFQAFLAKDYDPRYGLVARLNRVPPFLRAWRQAFLAFSFGYKPTAADAYALGGVYWHALQKLDFLRRSYGKPTPLNYSYHWVGPNEDDPTDQAQGYVTNTRLILGFQEVEFKAHTILYHKLQGLDSSMALLRALGAATGFGNPLLVAWDKIPYSFIIDWAFRLSNVLQGIAFQPFQGDWILQSPHYTLKHTGIVSVWESAYPTLNSHKWVKCGDLYFKRFIRELSLPVNVASLGLPSFDSTQQALILSLILNNQSKV